MTDRPPPTTILDTPAVRAWLTHLLQRGQMHGADLARWLSQDGHPDGSSMATVVLDRLHQAMIIRPLGNKPQPTVTQRWGGVGGQPGATTTRPHAPAVCWAWTPGDLVTVRESVTQMVEDRLEARLEAMGR